MNATLIPDARRLLSMAVTLALAACGGAEDASAVSEAATTEAAPPESRVVISGPEHGSDVDGPSVNIVLQAEGLAIVPAGVDQPGSGHHHLIVNADFPAMDVPIPAVPGESIHLGQAQTEFELTELSPGEYRVIAVVGDHLHVPLNPPVSDTVHFTVRE